MSREVSLLKEQLQFSAVPSIHCSFCYTYCIMQKFAKSCILSQSEVGQYFSCIFFSQQLTFPGETVRVPLPPCPLPLSSASDSFPLPVSHPSQPQLSFSLSFAGCDSAEMWLWLEQTVKTRAGGSPWWHRAPPGHPPRGQQWPQEWERSRVGRQGSMQTSLLSGSGKQTMTEKNPSNLSAGYFCVPRTALICSLLARPQGSVWQMGKGFPGCGP